LNNLFYFYFIKKRHKIDRKTNRKKKMGGTFSSAVVTATEVTETINKVVVTNAQSCAQNGNATQNIVINGNNDVIQNSIFNQDTEFNFSCFGQTANQVSLLNDLTNAITSKANSNSQLTLGLAFAQSADFNETISKSLNSTLISTIQSCAAQDSGTQNLTLNGNFDQVVGDTLNQNSKFFSTCVFGSNNITNLSNQVANNINAQADASAGFSFGLIVIIIVVILVVVVVIIAVMIKFFPFDKVLDAAKDPEIQKLVMGAVAPETLALGAIPTGPPSSTTAKPSTHTSKTPSTHTTHTAPS
jgi:hypothetical protein